MSNVLEQSEIGREIARRNWEQGFEQGFKEGFKEGFERGCADSMRALLRATFGEFADLDDLARQLADLDLEGNIGRIVAGATLAELRS